MALSGVVEETDSAAATQGGTRHYVALVVVGFALLQALWIVTVPPFRGVDEFDHAYRAAGVAHGQWRATEWADNGRGILVAVPEELVEAAHDQCASLDYTGPDNCSPAGRAGDLVLVGSGAGGYNPAYYAVVGVLAGPFDGVTSLYIMRVVTALLCLLMVGMAAWSVAIRSRSRWSRAGLVFAVTPVMLYSTAIVAPNGVELCAALCFWSALLSLDGSATLQQERRLLWVAAGSASVLMVDRMLGPLFALSILLTVWLLNPSLVRRVVTVHRRVFVLASVVVLASATYAVTWFLLSGAGSPEPGNHQGGGFVWTHPILWIFQSIAAFPTRSDPGAMVVYPIVLLIFVLLVSVALARATPRARRVLILTMVVSVAIPLLLTAATYAGRGSMWQGRYGLPYAMGVVLIGALLLDRSGLETRLRGAVLTLASVAMGIGTAACLVKLVTDESVRDVSRLDPGWLQPAPAVLVTGTAAAWTLLRLGMGTGARATH